MIIEPLYVTDINALYWYLSGNRKLSAAGLVVFQAAKRGETQIVVSAISIAELYLVNHKWQGIVSFELTYVQLNQSAEFLVVPLEADDVLDFDRDIAIPEMHDRIIVGLARRLNVPLITSDGIITASGIVRVVW